MMDKTIKSGRYITEEYYKDYKTGEIYETSDGKIIPKYRVTIDIKVTEKSYIFTLVDIIENYGAAYHFDDLFRESKRLVIRRDKPSKHAIHTWSDDSFTLYPYRVGTPYVFNRC